MSQLIAKWTADKKEPEAGKLNSWLQAKNPSLAPYDSLAAFKAAFPPKSVVVEEKLKQVTKMAPMAFQMEHAPAYAGTSLFLFFLSSVAPPRPVGTGSVTP